MILDDIMEPFESHGHVWKDYFEESNSQLQNFCLTFTWRHSNISTVSTVSLTLVCDDASGESLEISTG